MINYQYVPSCRFSYIHVGMLLIYGWFYNNQIQIDSNRWLLVPSATKDKVKLLKGGSINYHRNVFIMSVFLRFVILWPLFSSICLFVQSYSSLYSSFTNKLTSKKVSQSVKAN